MGETEGFLITREVSNRSPVAQSELCGHQHTPKQHEPRSVAAIQLPSTSSRSLRWIETSFCFTFSPLQVTHCARTVNDCASRSAFCEQFFTLVNEHPDVIRTGSSHMTLILNRQNMRHWSEANPNEVHVEPLHSQSVLGYQRLVSLVLIFARMKLAVRLL